MGLKFKLPMMESIDNPTKVHDFSFGTKISLCDRDGESWSQGTFYLFSKKMIIFTDFFFPMTINSHKFSLYKEETMQGCKAFLTMHRRHNGQLLPIDGTIMGPHR